MATSPTRGKSRAARLGDTVQHDSGVGAGRRLSAVTNELSSCRATWTCVKLTTAGSTTRATASMVKVDNDDNKDQTESYVLDCSARRLSAPPTSIPVATMIVL